MAPVVTRLLGMIEQQGWKGRVVSIGHLADLWAAIVDRHERGLFAERLHREHLSGFDFDHPSELPGARSILVVAVPTPQVRLSFHWKRRQLPVVVPPTYVSYTKRMEDVQSILAAWLEPEGYGLAKPRLPLKTLAAGAGLAKYGRNNICYVPGMGSFFELVGAFSDLPPLEDAWHEPAALDRCASCVACVRRCPTGAITAERFLLHAERCLTYHNEADADFPAWVDPSWHHCLVGCMLCQSVCPENQRVIGWFEDRAEFSEAETGLLRERVALERLPAATAAKLRALEINEDHRLLCRNLALVLDRMTAAT